MSIKYCFLKKLPFFLAIALSFSTAHGQEENRGTIVRKVTENWERERNIWVGEEDEITRFDEENRILYREYRIFNELTGGWETQNYYYFTYDQHGNQTLRTDRIKLLANNRYITRLMERTFNANNQVTRFTRQTRQDGFFDWNGELMLEYDYNENGCQTEVRFFEEGLNNQGWVLKRRTLNEYDQACRLLVQTEEVWDFNRRQWQPDERTTYTFASAEEPNLTTQELWNPNANQWQIISEIRNFFDQQGNVVEKETFVYRPWIPNYQQFIEQYDARGNLSFYALFQRNSPTGQWRPSYEYFLDYNPDDQLVFLSLRSRPASINFWTYEVDVTYAYNPQGNQIKQESFTREFRANIQDFIEYKDRRESEFAYYCNDLVKMETTFRGLDSRPNTRTAYNYVEETDCLEGLSAEAMLVFPNPTNGLVEVHSPLLGEFGTQVDVLDLTGKSMQRVPINFRSSFLEIDLGGMPKGMYIIRLQGKSGFYTKKVVKR